MNPPEAADESYRSLLRSEELYRQARQVAAVSRAPGDAAFLASRSIYQLMSAVLCLDGARIESDAECLEKILAAPEYAQLFAPVIDELPYLKKLVGAWATVTARHRGRDDRLAALLKDLPALQRRVRLRIAQRPGGGRGRRLRRVLLIGAALIAAFGVPLTFGVARNWARRFAAFSTEAPLEIDERILNNPQRCFRATYFADQTFEKEVHVRRDCAIHFNWGTQPVPDIPELSEDRFSVRWQGILVAPASATYTFFTRSDDGSVLRLDGQPLVDNWGSHSTADQKSEPIMLTQGVGYPIEIEYYESGGEAEIGVSWQWDELQRRPLTGEHVFVPGAKLDVPRDRGSTEPSEVREDPLKCWSAQYFSGVAFDEHRHTRRDCRIDFNWRRRAPNGVADLSNDNFSVRWDGALEVPATDDYIFYLASDDGSRLFLDGTQLIDIWGLHGLIEVESPAVRLERGVQYPLRVEYFEKNDAAEVHLRWSSPSLPGDEEKPMLSGRYITPLNPPAPDQ